MTANPSTIDRDWPQLDRSVRDASLTQCIGVFDASGEPLYLNQGMQALLGGENPSRPRAEYLINPAFSAFWEDAAGDGETYNGLLTVGDGLSINRTVKARGWRQGDRLLIVGEFDVLELDRLNTELSRTNQEISNLQRELVKKNLLLEATLDQLRQTQRQLVESEKMAALGALVAGVAHEINTPAGVGLISVSSLKKRLDKLDASFADDALSFEELRQYLDDTRLGLDLINGNLQRIAGLVSEFKRISTNQDNDREREVALKPYLENIVASLGERLRPGAVAVRIECDERFKVRVFPEALVQIITNLLTNSLDHGFKDRDKGEIRILVRRRATDWIIDYRDDGQGVSGTHLDKLFDPFFTTDRPGHFGLGLHVLYNLVTQKMRGSVHCESEYGKGFRIEIRFPLPNEREGAKLEADMA